jgi:hypothetical protein
MRRELIDVAELRSGVSTKVRKISIRCVVQGAKQYGMGLVYRNSKSIRRQRSNRRDGVDCARIQHPRLEPRPGVRQE